MKKLLIVVFVFLIVASSGYYLVKTYWFPKYVAHMIVMDEDVPDYLPQKVQKGIVKAKKKVNPLVGAILSESYKGGLTLEELLDFVENTDEELVFTLADSVSGLHSFDANQVFDLANDILKPQFNTEVLRDAFNQHVSEEMIKVVIMHYKANREELQSSPEIGRQIIKQILIEKDKQIKAVLAN